MPLQLKLQITFATIICSEFTNSKTTFGLLTALCDCPCKMSAENGITIQHQIRENSDEIQNVLKDLNSWEKEMKKKEEEWKLLQISDEQVVPPIRNVLSRSKKKNRHKKTEEKLSPKKERISSYNYKAWEKFDAESELMKLDDEKKESSGSDSSEKEEELSKQKNQQLALIKKDKGNDFFKKGNYDSAINSYTVGMELDPENPLLPANRAMAFLKKEQFQAAENDCTLCLSLDPTYVKAYLRRGTARNALHKSSLAKSDFLKVLELEPDCKQAQMELEKLSKEANVKNSSNELRNNQECNENISIESYDHNGASALKDHTFKSFDYETYNSHGDSVEIQESFIKMEATNFKPDDFREYIAKKYGFNARELKHRDNLADAETNTTCLSKQSNSFDKAKAQSDTQLNNIGHLITRLEQSLPPVPSTSFQFLTDWKKFVKYPDLKYQYLKQFRPEQLHVLFKYSMEADIFPEILHTLSTSFIENGDDVFQYMKCLSSVGRFNTMLLFLSKTEQQDLQVLSSYVKASGYTSSEVETLFKLYKIS